MKQVQPRARLLVLAGLWLAFQLASQLPHLHLPRLFSEFASQPGQNRSVEFCFLCTLTPGSAATLPARPSPTPAVPVAALVAGPEHFHCGPARTPKQARSPPLFFPSPC